MSDSVRPHRRQPTRFPCPWDSPGKNTGVGCHFLLQCMKVKSESEVSQSCLTLSNPMDCSLLGSSIHRIFQARVLEWGAIAFKCRASLIVLRLLHSLYLVNMEIQWENLGTTSCVCGSLVKSVSDSLMSFLPWSIWTWRKRCISRAGSLGL